MRRFSNSLAVRLTIWFLLLSVLPLAVMAVFVRRNVFQALVGLEMHYRRERVRGLVAGAAALGDVNGDDMLRRLLEANRAAGDVAFIVNEHGTYLAHADEDEVGYSAYEDYSDDVVATVTAGGDGALINPDGDRLVGYAEIPRRDPEELRAYAVVITGQLTTPGVMMDLERISFIQLAVSLVIVAVVGGFAIWVVVGKPIRQLTSAAKEIGAGDLDVTVDPSDMEDELKVLATTFNQMAARLRDLVGGLEEHVARLEQAEATLRQSEERFRLIAESSAEDIWQLGLDGQVTYASPAVHSIFGYTPDEALELDFSTFIHESDVEVAAEAFGRAVAGESYQLLELMGRRKDGATVSIEVSVTPITRDEEIIGVQGITRDITERKRAQAALRESEERFRILFEEAPDAIFIESLADQILDANRAATRMLGYSREEFQAMTVADLLPPGGRRRDLGSIVSSELAGGDFFESQDMRKDGTLVPVEIHNRRIRIAGEDLVLSVVRDIAGRKRAERALRRSEERFKLAMEATQDGLWDWDIRTDEVYYSPSYARMLGYEPGEIRSDLSGWVELIHPEDEAAVLQVNMDCIQNRRDAFEVEYRLRAKDGEWRWVLGRGRAVDRDRKGQVLRIVGTHSDITERKRAEEERRRLAAQIREQARRMERVLTTVPAGVLLIDSRGCVVQANPEAQTQLAVLAGVEEGELLTQLGDRPLAELLTSPPTTGLWHEVRADGRIFEVIPRAVGDGSASESWVLVLRDVTQEREIEQHVHQQERLAAVGQLAAGIAHDFNNIMAIIVLYTQLGLRKPDLSHDLRSRLEVIADQAQRAAQLIEQILDFSRRAVLERRPMDMTPFLKEICKLLERTLPEYIQVVLTYDPGEHTVAVDPTRLQQALLNLAFNARDAMPDGGTLRLTFERLRIEGRRDAPLPEMETGDWVRITVSDTGHGISPDVLPRIFEPFFTTKEVGKGTGLGLAQVFGIVKQHDGHIDVDSQVGVGTTFTLYFPALVGSQPLDLPRKSDTGVEGHGEIILVVEDNERLRAAMAETLTTLNYQVLEASHGREALEILEDRAAMVDDGIGLVVSDLVMPEMGGEALFRAVQQHGLDLPMIIMTGHPQEDELRSLQEEGLSGWLLKPPDIGELSRLLAAVLSGKSG